jgi:hypothetical protein
MRVGDDDFAGAIEVRRTVALEHGDWWMGATFVALEGPSRQCLEQLLAPTQ